MDVVDLMNIVTWWSWHDGAGVVAGWHQMVELSRRRPHPMVPGQSQSLHVRKGYLGAHLQGFEVKFSDVEALVGLHHGMGDQAVQPSSCHVRIQF